MMNGPDASPSAVNSHLRRYTETFKCGHCGKMHTNSSEMSRKLLQVYISAKN